MEEIRRNELTHTYVSHIQEGASGTNVGRSKYVDVNHDGLLDLNDMVYLGTGDPVIAELYAKMEALKLEIKEREEFLRTVPASGIQVGFTESFVDEETGELKEYNKLYDVHPPVRQSERILKVTLKK